MAKPKIKHTITKKEWNKKHKDFKTIIDGTPYIMMYDDKVGTHLVPVKIVEESIDEAKRGEFEVGDFVHFKSANKTGLVRGIKGDKVTIMTMKGNYTGDIKDVQVLYQDGVNEMDLNDPIMMKLRAAQMKKNKDAAKKIDTEKQNKNAIKIKALKKKRAEVMRDMEQEAEPEGGKIADRYGKLLNRIDNDIIKLGGNPMTEAKKFKQVKKDKYGNHLEPQFKKGDKVTYLGNKGVITGVNRESSGVYSYNVDYYKGNGRTKASNIFNKSGNDLKIESVNEEQINEWKLQLDLGKVNPSEFENWASDSLQKKHKIKVSGSGTNWTIVGKGNDDRMGSSADWISQLLGKAWTGNKIKVVQKESVNEASDVEVYHKSYTHAIEAAKAYALKKGYEIEDDEMFTKVGMNSKRPSVGKTTRVSLELMKGGKPQRKMLHIQVYGMKNGYELNAYIN